MKTKSKLKILTKGIISNIYKTVFRQDLNQSGFYYLKLGTELNSKEFRQLMVDIKNELSVLCTKNLKKELHYQSLGRFNHQDSSKPHRDTADNH